jgi:hypothetical protein
VAADRSSPVAAASSSLTWAPIPGGFDASRPRKATERAATIEVQTITRIVGTGGCFRDAKQLRAEF